MMIRRAAKGATFGMMTAAALAATLTSAAFADTTPTENSTTASADQVKPAGFADKIFANYYGIVAGPAIGDISVNTHDSTGATAGTIGIDNRLTVGYKLDKKMSLGIYTRLITTFPDDKGNTVALKNPGLKLSHSSILKSGNFNLSGSATLYAPVTASAIKNNMITGLALSQFSTIEIPGSRWTVIALTGQAAYAYGANAPYGSPTLLDGGLFAYAGLNYQWKSNLSVVLTTGTSFDHVAGRGLDGFVRTADATDIEIGMSWDVTKKINLNPYLALFPVEGISANSTSIGMYVSAGLL